MASVNVFMTLVLVSWLTPLCSSESSKNGDSYVRDACSVTQYRDLCIHSLAPFSNKAKRNPSKWARAGVSVTISEAKTVFEYLLKLNRSNSMRGRDRAVLSDCIECLEDTLDNLHRSLGVLRKLNDMTFNDQMGDVITWMSAALTDEDTCLDGFDDKEEINQVNLLQNRVTNMTCITSNALALVNKLA
ncbi:unnamed protein product, partial [Ilex paraguariensis]